MAHDDNVDSVVQATRNFQKRLLTIFVKNAQRMCIDRGFLSLDDALPDDVIDNLDLSSLSATKRLLHELLYSPPGK